MGLSVTIDAFRLVTEPFTSNAIYVSELVKSQSVLDEFNKVYLLVPRKPGYDFIYNDLLHLKNVEFIWPNSDVFPERTFGSQVYWIQWVIPHLVRRRIGSTHYYVAPYHHPPLLLPRKLRVVTVIHDLCGLRADCGYGKTKKGYYRHLFMFVMASIRSDLLIPISEYTRSQLKRTFPFLGPRIANVVYNGVSGDTVSDTMVNETLRRYNVYQNKYFIAFGAPGKRKGLDLILGGYKLYRNRGGQASLVLIVANDARARVRQSCEAEGLTDVVMVSHITASERDALYRGALSLLFPSRCEGLGYPLIEAMRQGCPPIAWRNGPASEIVDSVIPLLRNLDKAEIADHMFTCANVSPDMRLTLADRLIKRSYNFQGDRFGRGFVEAMKGLSVRRQ